MKDTIDKKQAANRARWLSYKNNPEKLAAYYAKQRVREQQYRQTVLDHYGNACACCSENTPEFLAIDHVNNDGAAHRKSVGGSTYATILWIIRNEFPSSFQILCHNCNAAKAIHGNCPHQ